MPIYEFHCAECRQDSEILLRSSNWNGAKCPHCGSLKLHKKFSTFAAAGAGATKTSSSPKSAGGHGCGGACSCH